MKTIDYIDALRNEAGKSKVIREPIFEDYEIEVDDDGNKSCDELLELLANTRKMNGEKGACLLFKYIAENGTAEDFEKVRVAIRKIQPKIDYDLSEASRYLELVQECKNKHYITNGESEDYTKR